jgi:hypothetical protein
MEIDPTTVDREFAHMTEDEARLLWRVTPEMKNFFHYRDHVRLSEFECWSDFSNQDLTREGFQA